MEYTLSTHLLVYAPLAADALAAIRAAGYRSVELWLAEPHVPWRDPQALEDFRARVEGEGLRAASVHLPFYPSVPEWLQERRGWSLIAEAREERAEALAATRDAVHAAAALGAREAVLHLGGQGDAWAARHAEWARAAVGTLLEEASAAGVRLLLENIISGGTRAARLRALLDELDPERRAGICLDLGHAHVEGDVLEQLEDAGPRLAHLHVHDNDGSADDHRAAGEGSIAWPRVTRWLAERGFEGMAAHEVRDPSRGTEPAAEMLARALPRLRRFEEEQRAVAAP